jgi:hypothetical protein
MGWQLTPSNIGLAGVGLTESDLTSYTGSTTPAAGTTITRKIISSPLDCYSQGGNITLDQCLIRPTYVHRGSPLIPCWDGGVTIRDCEFDGSLVSAYDMAFTCCILGEANVLRNYIHGFGSGVAIFGTGMQDSVLVEHNLATDMTPYGDPSGSGNHIDAFTVREFKTSTNPTRTATIRNNWWDCGTVNASGAVFLQAYAGFIDNVTFEGNLLTGGGFLCALETNTYQYGDHMSFVDNRFLPDNSNNNYYGTHYVSGGPGWATWSDNYIYDAGQPQARGDLVTE